MAIEPKTTREHIVSLYGHVKGVKKDINTKFSLLTNYTFTDNTNLFLNTSAKKTNSKQETYSLNLGFKSIF